MFPIYDYAPEMPGHLSGNTILQIVRERKPGLYAQIVEVVRLYMLEGTAINYCSLSRAAPFMAQSSAESRSTLRHPSCL